MIARRGFLRGVLAAGMAPAIVKAGILMPIRPIVALDTVGGLQMIWDHERLKNALFRQRMDRAQLAASPPVICGFDLGSRDMSAQVWMRRDGPFYRLERIDTWEA